jgi:hypothetical protein
MLAKYGSDQLLAVQLGLIEKQLIQRQGKP